MNWPAFESLYGGQFTISTQLIKPVYQNSHKTSRRISVLFRNELIVNALLIDSVASYFIVEQRTVLSNLHTSNPELSHALILFPLQPHRSQKCERDYPRRSLVRLLTLSCISTIDHQKSHPGRDN